MIVEAFTWYFESVSAFWTGFARGGMLQLLMFGFVIWWFCCRRRGRCFGCSSCGCWCGHCRCHPHEGHGHHHHHGDHDHDDAGDAKD